MERLSPNAAPSVGEPGPIGTPEMPERASAEQAMSAAPESVVEPVDVTQSERALTRRRNLGHKILNLDNHNAAVEDGAKSGNPNSPKIEDDTQSMNAEDRETGDGAEPEGADGHETWRRQGSFVQAETEPDYNIERTPAELAAHPEWRFDVNPDRFPIMRDQAINKVRINIDETLSLMVQDTADTIALITGEVDPPERPCDAVIYLDKSARPVSWLVNEMWDDFTDAPRPEYEGFLAIDRVNWFRAVGLNVDKNGVLLEDYGTSRANEKAKYSDFKRATEERPIRRSDLARARLALIENGLDKLRASMSEAELIAFDQYNPLAFESKEHDTLEIAPELPEWIVEKIFAIPTGLEGKKIMAVDEVENSGATVQIAQEIVKKAVNDPETEVITHIFWMAGTKQTQKGEYQMESTPVWYDHDINSELGKGIGNVDFARFRREFANQPNLEHLNALYIAPFRGRSLDMSGQEGESSVELMKEIQRLAKIYREDRILMTTPLHYSVDKWIEHYEPLGVEFGPGGNSKNSYLNLRNGLKR